MDTIAAPVSCVEPHPTGQTIQLRGIYINLSAISRSQNIDVGYLSRILSGKRDPSRMTLGQAMKIAAAIGMSVEDLMDAIYERFQKLTRDKAQVRIWHEYRMAEERREDQARLRKGLPLKPRVPIPDR